MANNRKNAFFKFNRSTSSGFAGLAQFNRTIRQNAKVSTGVFCLVCVLLIVGVWQLMVSSGHSQANASNSPDVSNGSSIDSNVSPQAGSQPVNSDITIQQNGGGPASISVNGQPVNVSQNGSAHKDVTSSNGTTSVDVNVSNGSSTNTNSQNTSVFSNSSSFVNSNTQVNSFSFSSGGTTISN